MDFKYKALVAVTAGVALVDLGIKGYVHTNFSLSETIPVIPNFFNFTYVRNPGAAFGFLGQSPETFRKLFFLLMPLVACAVIVQILRSVPNSDKAQIFALSSIMGGALGNYFNRIFTGGYVIDFLDFHFYYKYNWPAFNIADIAIVCGTGSLLFFMLREKKPKPSAQ
jgi:signal peptidase II